MSQQDEEYLSLKEACERLEVSRRTLERYVEHRRIKKYRQEMTRRVFFKRSEVESLRQQRLEKTPSEENPHDS